MNIYYVYLYLRSKNSDTALAGTPYYVGKGKGKRAYHRQKGDVPKPSDPSKIIILRDNLTENEAFLIEKEQIKLYGRVDNGTGILRNMTDGGEGSSGYKHTNHALEKIRQSGIGHLVSEETRKKISESQKGKIVSSKTRKKQSDWQIGRKFSSETIKKRQESRKGYKHSTETKQKMSASQKGCIGRLKTEEEKRKISSSLKEKSKPPFSEEHRKNLSESKKGKSMPSRSEEHRRRISESKRGKKRNAETIKKITETKIKNGTTGKGRKISEETRQKMKLAAAERERIRKESRTQHDPVQIARNMISAAKTAK